MPNLDSTTGGLSPAHERRATSVDHPLMAGVNVRDSDLEPTRGLHSVAILFRVLAGLLGVIVILQIISTMTTPGDGVSYGALLAEVIRLVIFAGLLWGAGELADLLVKSHRDLRAARILLGRLAHHIGAGDPTTSAMASSDPASTHRPSATPFPRNAASAGESAPSK